MSEHSPPKFSIVIPAYNSEKYITKGLNSIVNQTFHDYELIVVCDSCVDRTEDVAKSYGAITIPVNYRHDGLTRNTGINAAKGEWLLFMDDDDWFLHEYVFQQLADHVGRNDEDALMFSYIWKGKGYVRNTPEEFGYHVWSKCWRRAFVGDDVRFGIRSKWSDVDFTRHARNKMRKAVFWDMPMYYYNFLREGSISYLFANRLIR